MVFFLDRNSAYCTALLSYRLIASEKIAWFIIGFLPGSISTTPKPPKNRTSTLIKFIGPILVFLLHLGYFGPVLMGILDSSFLFFPFGNDLLVVTLVARHHQGWPWYVLAAALGSTIGVFVLALVAHKLVEEGIQRMAGEKRFARLNKMINTHGRRRSSSLALPPPPFPSLW